MPKRTTLVADAGVIFAALNPRDRHHDLCTELLAGSSSTTVPASVLVEIDWLSRSRKVRDATDRILASVEDMSLIVVDADLDDYRRIRWLVRRYADLPLSFVDASVVTVAERLEQTRVATLDRRHFGAIKPLHVPAFELVP